MSSSIGIIIHCNVVVCSSLQLGWDLPGTQSQRRLTREAVAWRPLTRRFPNFRPLGAPSLWDHASERSRIPWGVQAHHVRTPLLRASEGVEWLLHDFPVSSQPVAENHLCNLNPWIALQERSKPHHKEVSTTWLFAAEQRRSRSASRVK